MTQKVPEKQQANPFVTEDGKLNTDVISKLGEVLKTSGEDPYKLLGIEAPKPAESKTPKSNPQEVEKLKEIASFAIQSLKEEHGIDIMAKPEDVKTSKMSEYEAIVDKKIEKVTLAKFAEQIRNLKKTSPDFPVEAIEKLDIPADAKVEVATALQSVVDTYSSAISKMQGELDAATKNFEEIQTRVPQEPKEDNRSGKDRLVESMSKMGMDPVALGFAEKQVNPSEQLVDAISKLAEQRKK